VLLTDTYTYWSQPVLFLSKLKTADAQPPNPHLLLTSYATNTDSYSIGTEVLPWGDKAAGARRWPLTSTSDKVGNEWSYKCVPSICLDGVDRDNFTFLTKPTTTAELHLCGLIGDSQPSGYAENLDNWIFLWKQATHWQLEVRLLLFTRTVRSSGQTLRPRRIWSSSSHHAVLYLIG
jgi:hypothetical protein